MTRVASFSHNQSMLHGILRNQDAWFTAQQQINTGKKSQDYKGIASDASSVVSARSLMERAETFKKTTQHLDQALSTYDLQLDTMLKTTRSLRQTVLSALSTGDAQGFKQTLESDFGMVASSLNTSIGGSYLFSGSQTATKPFVANTLDELVALPAVGDAFANDQLKASSRVTDTFEMEYGLLANEVAEPVMEIMKALKVFNDGPSGPIDGKLNDTQKTFLKDQMEKLDIAIQGMQNHQVANGLRQKRIEEVSEQMSQQRDYWEVFISDIEDVNMAEAVSRLQNDQAALEASYRVMGTLTQLNLSKFI